MGVKEMMLGLVVVKEMMLVGGGEGNDVSGWG